jgi:hypothetical protein
MQRHGARLGAEGHNELKAIESQMSLLLSWTRKHDRDLGDETRIADK